MHIEFLVEEPSVEPVLRSLLDPILPNGHSFKIIIHHGKDDLLKKLPAKLAAYSRWIDDTIKIIVLIDRDDDDCKSLKANLEESARKANLLSRSYANGGSFNIANRIIIEELESWFFGAPYAINLAYSRAKVKGKLRINAQNPEQIVGGTWEALERILRSAGYFQSGFRKIEAAERISKFMDPKKNTSVSFRVFWNVIEEILS